MWNQKKSRTHRNSRMVAAGAEVEEIQGAW